MGRKMAVDEDKIFDACALVEEIVKHLTAAYCFQGSAAAFAVDKASKASLLLNQAMKEGELV